MVVFVGLRPLCDRCLRARALGYLLKPVDERLASARPVRSWHQRGRSRSEPLMALLADLTGKGEFEHDELAALSDRPARRFAAMLPIRVGRETVRLDVATIDWIDAAGDYMCLHAGGQTHVLRATMKELEEMLDPDVFQRVHRSTIVNLARVRSLRPHSNGECFLSRRWRSSSRSFRDKVELLLDRAPLAVSLRSRAPLEVAAGAGPSRCSARGRGRSP
jgi:two-component system LytT family response regulator